MSSYFSLGNRLKQAREQAGMNQTEAAAALGITSAALSQYESGKRKVEALSLESLSQLYGVPLGYFFGEDKPLTDWEVALRSLAQNLSPQGQAGISHLIASVHNLEQLYQLTDTAYPGVPHPPFRAMASEAASNYEVAEYANKSRRHYDLGVAPLYDLRRFTEALGYQIFAFSFGKEPDSLTGVFFQHEKLGPIVALNSDGAYSCRSFTLAMALAHGHYHYDRPAILWREADSRPSSRFAHRFAFYFLIPLEALHSRLLSMKVKTVTRPEEVVHLARYFGVSFEVMCRRLIEEQRLDASSWGFEQVKPVALALALGYSPLPYELGVSPLPPEERLPRVFLELAYRAVQSKQISLRRAAELLGISDIEMEERLYPEEAEALEEVYA